MIEMCRFCNIVDADGNIATNKDENQPIWSDDGYFALASIGALIEGWVLIIPKTHVFSMKECYKEEGFINFTNEMLYVMNNQYNKSFIAFEHGANKCESETSCGTNHAHLHIIPYQNSLYEDMRSQGLVWKKCKSSQISSYVGNNEYLFYTEISANSAWSDPEGFVHILEYPISQFFRKLIANQLNCPDKYNYKQYPRIDTAIKTKNILSEAMNV